VLYLVINPITFNAKDVVFNINHVKLEINGVTSIIPMILYLNINYLYDIFSTNCSFSVSYT